MISGREPRVSLDGIRLAKKRMFFSVEKARRALGPNPRPVDEAFRDALDWFRKNGYLKQYR